MDIKAKIKSFLDRETYRQSFISTALVSFCGRSGITMAERLDYRYEGFLFRIKNGQGDMWYLKSDLDRLWGIIKERLAADPEYLSKVKSEYEEIFAGYNDLYEQIRRGLTDLSDEELVTILHTVMRALTDSVGISHIIEPIGQHAEKDLEAELAKLRDPRPVHELVAILTQPSELSFLSREERELQRIGELPAGEQEAALETHRDKYHWIQNSYLGSKNLSVDFFRAKMEELHGKEFAENGHIRGREELLAHTKFPREVLELAGLIDFTSVWQDERKANIYRAIGYADAVYAEIAQRTGMDRVFLRQIGAYDLKTLASLDDVRALKNALVARAEHGVFILEDGECSVLSGADFNEIESYIQLGEEIQKITALKGTVASKGKARGTVSLCLTLDDIESFKEGDILVTSMTRPEFMPAMKKAAAFVTDEGGITCHAAIVSRELKKPCIIGTKNATQVLRSGDIVEVDAEKGMVHIISRVIRPSHALETTHV